MPRAGDKQGDSTAARAATEESQGSSTDRERNRSDPHSAVSHTSRDSVSDRRGEHRRSPTRGHRDEDDRRVSAQWTLPVITSLFYTSEVVCIFEFVVGLVIYSDSHGCECPILSCMCVHDCSEKVSSVDFLLSFAPSGNSSL